jgi:hypothetical protein
MKKSEASGGNLSGGSRSVGRTSAGAPLKPASLLYREVQRLQQWLFWVPIAIAAVVIWWAFFKQVVFGGAVGREPIPDWLAWVLAMVFGIGLPALGWAMRLITQVHPGLLWVRLSPFRGIRIPADEIESAFTREYSAIREFGGWGVRTGRSGRAYNAYGNKGVQLVLTDGSRVLIGSQRPDDLLGALALAGADVDRT